MLEIRAIIPTLKLLSETQLQHLSCSAEYWNIKKGFDFVIAFFIYGKSLIGKQEFLTYGGKIYDKVNKNMS